MAGVELRSQAQMVWICAYLAYCLAVVIATGIGTRRLLARIAGLAITPETAGLTETFALGIVGLTSVTAFCSAFAPVSCVLHLAIVGSIVVYAAIDRQTVAGFCRGTARRLASMSRPLLLAGVVCTAAALIRASSEQVSLYDTGLYHAQAVKWLREYGATPGLGNLHERLAFNSSWFAFASFFDQFAFAGKSHHIVNVVAYLFGLSICLGGAGRLCAGGIALGSIIRIFMLPLLVICARHNLSSLSPDPIAAYFVFYLMILAVDALEWNRDPQAPRVQHYAYLHVFATTIACFAVTLKLSCTPALAVVVLLLVMADTRGRRQALRGVFLSLAVLVPFVIGNRILSGYAMYPFAPIDVFAPDWKMPRAEVDRAANDIRAWGIEQSPHYRTFYDKGVVAWAGGWFARNLRKPMAAIWLILPPSMLLLLIGHCILARDRLQWRYLLLGSAMFAGVVFWFVTGPTFRFSFAWLCGCAMLPVAVVASYRIRVRAPWWRRGTTSALAVYALWMVLVSGWHSVVLEPTVLWQVRPLPAVRVKTVEASPRLFVNIPVRGDQAWDAPLPSAPRLPRGVLLRGGSLGEGFRAARPETSIARAR